MARKKQVGGQQIDHGLQFIALVATGDEAAILAEARQLKMLKARSESADQQ